MLTVQRFETSALNSFDSMTWLADFSLLRSVLLATLDMGIPPKLGRGAKRIADRFARWPVAQCRKLRDLLMLINRYWAREVDEMSRRKSCAQALQGERRFGVSRPCGYSLRPRTAKIRRIDVGGRMMEGGISG
jgi:hypothetical protein